MLLYYHSYCRDVCMIRQWVLQRMNRSEIANVHRLQKSAY